MIIFYRNKSVIGRQEKDFARKSIFHKTNQASASVILMSLGLIEFFN